jgi:hypothetical protein
MILEMVYVYWCSVSAEAYLALVALARAHASYLCVAHQGLQFAVSYLVGRRRTLPLLV